MGAVNVNDAGANAFAHSIPMGGWKQSGIGTRAGVADGIRKYCRQQAITSPRIPTASKELLWFPSSPRRVKVALGVLRVGAARGLRRFGIHHERKEPRDEGYGCSSSRSGCIPSTAPTNGGWML